MYIDEEGYLCNTTQEFLDIDKKDMIQGDVAIGMQVSRSKKIKYKVNKEGLFEEVKKQEQTTYTGIETLGLSPRTLNALIMANILSIEKLKAYTEKELRTFKGVGNKAIRELALSQLRP